MSRLLLCRQQLQEALRHTLIMLFQQTATILTQSFLTSQASSVLKLLLLLSSVRTLLPLHRTQTLTTMLTTSSLNGIRSQRLVLKAVMLIRRSSAFHSSLSSRAGSVMTLATLLQQVSRAQQVLSSHRTLRSLLLLTVSHRICIRLLHALTAKAVRAQQLSLTVSL